jgi:putative peptidoglycan lipid II flippase
MGDESRTETGFRNAAKRGRLGAFARGTVWFGTGTAIALVFATARDLFLARTFGAGAVADFVLLAMSLAYSLAASFTATLDAVVLPHLGNASEARAFATLARIERGLATLLLWCSPILLFAIIGPARRAAATEGLTSVALVLLMSAALFIASGLLTFRLRCRLARSMHFFAAGGIPALLWIGTVLGAVVTTTFGGAWWPVLGCLLGSVCALSLAGPWSALRDDNPSSRTLHKPWRYSWLYVRRSMPLTSGAILFAVGIFLSRIAASLGPAGAVASLEYATRVFNVPTTLITASATAVFLPLMVRERRPADQGELRIYTWYVVLMASIACALSAGGPTIARILLGATQDQTALKGIALNILCLSAGLPAMFLANIHFRADQAEKGYHSTFVGGVAFVLATAATTLVLVLSKSWSLFGFAQTAGLSAVMSVLGVVGKSSMLGKNPQVVLAITLVSGLLAALAGGALVGYASSFLIVCASGVALGGWIVGFVTATLFNLGRAQIRNRAGRP